MGYSSGLKNKLNAKAESNNNICLSCGTMPFSTALFHMSWWLDFQHPLWQKWMHMYVHARTDKHTNLLSHTHFDNATYMKWQKDRERKTRETWYQWREYGCVCCVCAVCVRLCVHEWDSWTDVVLQFFFMCNPQLHHVTHQACADQRVNVAEYRLNSKRDTSNKQQFNSPVTSQCNST